jgi:hypothetical protein
VPSEVFSELISVAPVLPAAVLPPVRVTVTAPVVPVVVS